MDTTEFKIGYSLLTSLTFLGLQTPLDVKVACKGHLVSIQYLLQATVGSGPEDVQGRAMAKVCAWVVVCVCVCVCVKLSLSLHTHTSHSPRECVGARCMR